VTGNAAVAAVVIAYLTSTTIIGVTKATLAYRTTRRRDHAKQGGTP
jgi:hypothetical protein